MPTCPTLYGLQDFANRSICTDYATTDKIFFKSSNSVGVLFKSKQFCVSASPTIFLCTNTTNFFDIVKYLGVKLNALLSDDHSRNYQGGLFPPSFQNLGKITIFRAVTRKYLGKIRIFWAAI